MSRTRDVYPIYVGHFVIVVPIYVLYYIYCLGVYIKRGTGFFFFLAAWRFRGSCARESAQRKGHSPRGLNYACVCVCVLA